MKLIKQILFLIFLFYSTANATVSVTGDFAPKNDAFDQLIQFEYIGTTGGANYSLYYGVDGSGANLSQDVLNEILIGTANYLLAVDGAAKGYTWKNPDDFWDDLIDMVLTDGQIYVGNASNNPVSVSMSGDATISNTGVITVADDSHNHVYSNIDQTSSSNWRSRVSDPTGTGAWVFGTSPALTTPSISTSLTVTDGTWIGLGPDAGRILFDDLATDIIRIRKADVYFMGGIDGYPMIRVYDNSVGSPSYLRFYAYNGEGRFETAGDAPGALALQSSAHADVKYFGAATSGETREMIITGWRTGDAKRYLYVGVGVDAADTASFDGLGTYLFDGVIRSPDRFLIDGVTSTSYDYDLTADDVLFVKCNDDAANATITNDGDGSNGTLVDPPNHDTQDVSVDNHLVKHFVFNGTDEYITMPDHASYDLGDGADGAISLWFKRDGAPPVGEHMINFDDNQAARWAIYTVATTGEIKATFRRDSDEALIGGASLTSSAGFLDNAWHHAVLNYDGANIKLYIDGIEEDSKAEASATISTIEGTGQIGRHPSAANTYWQGGLDAVIVFDTSLTANDVKALYNIGSGTESLSGTLTYNISAIGPSATILPNYLLPDGSVVIEKDLEVQGMIRGSVTLPTGDLEIDGFVDAIDGFKVDSEMGITDTIYFTDNDAQEHEVVIVGGIIIEWNVD